MCRFSHQLKAFGYLPKESPGGSAGGQYPKLPKPSHRPPNRIRKAARRECGEGKWGPDDGATATAWVAYQRLGRHRRGVVAGGWGMGRGEVGGGVGVGERIAAGWIASFFQKETRWNHLFWGFRCLTFFWRSSGVWARSLATKPKQRFFLFGLAQLCTTQCRGKDVARKSPLEEIGLSGNLLEMLSVSEEEHGLRRVFHVSSAPSSYWPF